MLAFLLIGDAETLIDAGVLGIERKNPIESGDGLVIGPSCVVDRSKPEVAFGGLGIDFDGLRKASNGFPEILSFGVDIG